MHHARQHHMYMYMHKPLSLHEWQACHYQSSKVVIVATTLTRS